MTASLKSRFSRLTIASIAWAMLAMGVSAQTPPAEVRDTVELEELVVTGSHSPKALKDAPVVTRLITLHDIKIVDATNRST